MSGLSEATVFMEINGEDLKIEFTCIFRISKRTCELTKSKCQRHRGKGLPLCRHIEMIEVANYQGQRISLLM